MPTKYRGAKDEVRALDTFIKLARAMNSMHANLARHVAEDGDITMSQFGVLEALLHLGPLSQGDICQKLLLSGSNITTVIDNLEKRGFVTRTRRPGDRRVVEVDLTDSGRKLISRLFPAHARRIANLLSALTAKEQDQLGALCRTLGKSIVEPV
ncbi:MAG TPA: MarR family transcriptional regulator [Vicinamibacterales bacterium]|nr:MarR family transcriptional regulator [Vicinamibacterales bacterium]